MRRRELPYSYRNQATVIFQSGPGHLRASTAGLGAATGAVLLPAAAAAARLCRGAAAAICAVPGEHHDFEDYFVM